MVSVTPIWIKICLPKNDLPTIYFHIFDKIVTISGEIFYFIDQFTKPESNDTNSDIESRPWEFIISNGSNEVGLQFTGDNEFIYVSEYQNMSIALTVQESFYLYNYAKDIFVERCKFYVSDVINLLDYHPLGIWDKFNCTKRIIKINRKAYSDTNTDYDSDD